MNSIVLISSHDLWEIVQSTGVLITLIIRVALVVHSAHIFARWVTQARVTMCVNDLIASVLLIVIGYHIEKPAA